MNTHELIHARRQLEQWFHRQQPAKMPIGAYQQAMQCAMSVRSLELALPSPDPRMMAETLLELRKLEVMLGRRSAEHG